MNVCRIVGPKQVNLHSFLAMYFILFIIAYHAPLKLFVTKYDINDTPISSYSHQASDLVGNRLS